MLLAAVFLLTGICSATAGPAISISPPAVTLMSGSSVTYNIRISGLEAGLSGYRMQVRVTNPNAGQITAISFQINGGTPVTWTPPNGDFTQINFITLRFGGTGIPQVHPNDQVVVNVTVNSSEMNNYVAWHWARNTFGFHRVPFTFISSTPNGQNGYTDVFSKTFTIYANHKLGVFNGFINASTHESLYDDDPSKFASTEVGIPYRVVAQ